MPQSHLPDEIEIYRDRSWCREAQLQIEEVLAAERLIDRIGFCAALTDARRPGPSLYVAVCGRRDAHMPRNVQKDPESSLAWTIKTRLSDGVGFITASYEEADRCSSREVWFPISTLPGVLLGNKSP